MRLEELLGRVREAGAVPFLVRRDGFYRLWLTFPKGEDVVVVGRARQVEAVLKAYLAGVENARR